jgi:putative membrane protein
VRRSERQRLEHEQLHVKLGVVAAALAGLGIAAYLIFAIGIGAVFAAATAVGWSGFGLICILGLALFVILAPPWFVLIPPQFSPAVMTFIWGRAVRDSASEVLPFSHVGGIVIGARAIVLRGVDAPLAYASTIVDVTTEMAAQIVYVLVGVAILVTHVPKSPSSEWLMNTAVLATLVGTLGTIVFIVAQKRGFAIFEKLAERVLPNAAAQAGAFQGAMESIHASPLRIFISVVLHLFAWFAGAGATFVAVRLMGVRLGYESIVCIEALLCAVRSAAIFIPNALGVQEAAYAMLMPFFGLGAPVGLALSLLKRARDIAIGIPILLVWQAAEGHRALGKSNDSDLLTKDRSPP